MICLPQAGRFGARQQLRLQKKETRKCSAKTTAQLRSNKRPTYAARRSYHRTGSRILSSVGAAAASDDRARRRSAPVKLEQPQYGMQLVSHLEDILSASTRVVEGVASVAPSVTTWTRLEPRPREGSMARPHDPISDPSRRLLDPNVAL
jgi:hypothetical protein